MMMDANYRAVKPELPLNAWLDRGMPRRRNLTRLFRDPNDRRGPNRIERPYFDPRPEPIYIRHQYEVRDTRSHAIRVGCRIIFA